MFGYDGKLSTKKTHKIIMQGRNGIVIIGNIVPLSYAFKKWTFLGHLYFGE